MKRLIVAGCLAVGIHVALFIIRPQLTPPAMLMPQSSSVTISLVEAPPAPPKKILSPPAKKLKPKPKPEVAPAPAIETAPEPEPEPLKEIQSEEHDQKAREEEPVEDEKTSETPGAQEGAVIQSSVPRYDINPEPKYPSVARRRGYEGTVVLKVLVTIEGRTGQVTVVQSSGFKILDRRAVETVQKWLFIPALRGSEAVETVVNVPITFQLH